MSRVQRGKIPHAWWDAGDDLAWHSSGIGGTLHVFVEAGEIHCDPWFCGGLLRDHHHRVAPCEGLADRDLLDHPFGDHGGELGFDGRTPLERNSARPIVAARDCVIPEVNVHRRPGHRTERCVFEDCRELRHDGSLQEGHLGVRLCGSGGWCRGSAKWWMVCGQPSSRRPRLMQVDLLSNDTFSWLYTWSLVSHERPCRCRVAGMVPRDWSWWPLAAWTAWWSGAKFLSRLGSTVARSLALMASMSAPLSGSQRVSPTPVPSIWVWMATRWSAVRCA